MSPKSKETMEKVAEAAKKRADKAWAKAKDPNNSNVAGKHYNNAKKAYDTMHKAQDAAKKK